MTTGFSMFLKFSSFVHVKEVLGYELWTFSFQQVESYIDSDKMMNPSGFRRYFAADRFQYNCKMINNNSIVYLVHTVKLKFTVYHAQ